MIEWFAWALVGVAVPVVAAVLALTGTLSAVAVADAMFWVGTFYGVWTARINRRGKRRFK